MGKGSHLNSLGVTSLPHYSALAEAFTETDGNHLVRPTSAGVVSLGSDLTTFPAEQLQMCRPTVSRFDRYSTVLFVYFYFVIGRSSPITRIIYYFIFS